MGRHSSPDFFPAPPVRRLAGSRPRPAADRTVPGVRFPIVDDLAQIAADDRLLDYLAAGRTDLVDVFAGGSAGFAGGPPESAASARSVAPMLAGWRSELLEAPLPELPTIPAPKRVMRGPADVQARRSLKPILGVAAAICALLMGSAAVGAQSAQPGDALWGLTKVLYSSHAESVQAKAAATKSMETASSFLEVGKPADAATELVSASGEVDKVAVADGQHELRVNLKKLQDQVAGASDSGVASSYANSPNGGRVGAVSSAAAAKNGAAAGRSAAGKNAPGKTAGTSIAEAGKPAVTSANGAPDRSSDGSISPTVPGAPIAPPTGPTDGNPGGPGTDTGSPGTTAPVVPVPDSTDPGSVPDPGTSTTSEPPAPVTTDQPTTSDPSTSSDPPTTEPSTTSQMPTPTPTPTSDDGSGNQLNNNPASVENAQASQ